jgi:hypothetical protein
VDDTELARVSKERARAEGARLADPRQRLVQLFRGAPFAPQAPPPSDLRKAMAATFRDEALVVGAARAEPP